MFLFHYFCLLNHLSLKCCFENQCFKKSYYVQISQFVFTTTFISSILNLKSKPFSLLTFTEIVLEKCSLVSASQPKTETKTNVQRVLFYIIILFFFHRKEYNKNIKNHILKYDIRSISTFKTLYWYSCDRLLSEYPISLWFITTI